MTRPVNALLFAFMLVFSLSLDARADAPSAEAKVQARNSYAAGQQAFRAGDYAAALKSFQEAFTLVPNPVVLLSIAECQVRQGFYTDAVVSLQRYLDERPDAPDRVQVEAQIQKLREKPAFLTVESTPEGARVFLDGVDTGKVTPTDLEMKSGDHVVEVEADGYVRARREITLLLGARDKVAVELESAAPVVDPGPAPQPAVAQTEVDTGASSHTAAWIATGIAGAGLITGAVLGGLALSKRGDFDDNPTADTADKGERLALFADVGFGVAAAAGVTALVLWLTDDDDKPVEASALRVVPALSQRSAGVACGVSF